MSFTAQTRTTKLPKVIYINKKTKPTRNA